MTEERKAELIKRLDMIAEDTDDNPAEHRSFTSDREAVDYALRLAKAGYDESKMDIPILKG